MQNKKFLFLIFLIFATILWLIALIHYNQTHVLCIQFAYTWDNESQSFIRTLNIWEENKDKCNYTLSQYLQDIYTHKEYFYRFVNYMNKSSG